ncbi:MAG: CPBP family intramembrane glutamic endopeptidase [Pseudomonadota bacterium]
MSVRARLRGPLPVLLAAIGAALLAIAGARLLAAAAADRLQAAPVIALGLRSLLWAGLGAGLRSPIQAQGASHRRALPLALGLGLGTGLFSALVLRLAAGGLPAEAPLMPDPAALGAPWLALLALGALLLAPVGEELLFRGALLDSLAREHGDRIALFGSSAAFALVHLSPAHLVTAFVAGLALGWLRQHTARLWPCVLAHAVHNALWLHGAISSQLSALSSHIG